MADETANIITPADTLRLRRYRLLTQANSDVAEAEKSDSNARAMRVDATRRRDAADGYSAAIRALEGPAAKVDLTKIEYDAITGSGLVS